MGSGGGGPHAGSRSTHLLAAHLPSLFAHASSAGNDTFTAQWIDKHTEDCEKVCGPPPAPAPARPPSWPPGLGVAPAHASCSLLTWLGLTCALTVCVVPHSPQMLKKPCLLSEYGHALGTRCG